MTQPPLMKNALGIDGSKGGWLLAGIGQEGVFSAWSGDLEELIFSLDTPMRILIDMPIGLCDANILPLPTRPCDVAARNILKKKASTIFNPPCMEAMYAHDYAQACQINHGVQGKKISIQSWHITPQIRQLNTFLHLHSAFRPKVLEAHPELAFWWLNQKTPLRWPKKRKEGIIERLQLMEKYHPPIQKYFEQMQLQWRKKANPSDIVDALGLALLNWVRGEDLSAISENCPTDSLGSRMAIWL